MLLKKLVACLSLPTEQKIFMQMICWIQIRHKKTSRTPHEAGVPFSVSQFHCTLCKLNLMHRQTTNLNKMQLYV